MMFYYFDGMTIAEITKCMDCPEGTVSYQLSVARGKIKQGILEYEEKSGDKLYSVSGLTMLTAVFMLESREVSLPNILTTVFNNAKQFEKEQPEQKYIYVIKMPQGDLRQCEDGVPFDFAGHFRDDMNVVGMHMEYTNLTGICGTLFLFIIMIVYARIIKF